MKAQDLRIGNYIYDDENKLSKVVGFRPFDDSVRCDEEEGCDVLIDIFDDGIAKEGYVVESTKTTPIQLTEEWLVRFGFDKGFSDRDNRIQITNDCSMSIWLENKSDNCLIGDSLIVTVFYVHQLQNLYYALTGEELTLK